MSSAASALPPQRLSDSFDKNDLPRERLKRLGAHSLTNAELIAIILRIGTPGENVIQLAQRLLGEHHGLLGLTRVALNELTRTKGVGEAKAIELQAVFELGYRIKLESAGERPM